MNPPAEYNISNFAGCAAWDNEAELYKKIVEIVQPKNILETGFFRGGSAFMWLWLSKELETKVTSIDCFYDSEHPYMVSDSNVLNAYHLQQLFPNRFKLVVKPSQYALEDIKNQNFCLASLDSDHSLKGIVTDLNIALHKQIKFLLLDDADGPVIEGYNKFKDYYETIEIFSMDKQNSRHILFAKLKV